MPKYYVQKFTYTGGDSMCYGAMDAHDHDQSTKFSKDVKACLEGKGLKDVDGRAFQSNQPEPNDGMEFKWKNKKWVEA